ncbi:MAG: lactate racemase domain-containing protein [Pirellulaceae bacterium]
MPILWERSGLDCRLSMEDFREAIEAILALKGNPSRILAIPPDHTRSASRAGELTVALHELAPKQLVDIMPALGTHEPMSPGRLEKMFPGIPQDLFRIHRWRNDVVRLGLVDASYVEQTTEGCFAEPWPAEVNRLVVEGRHDLILSLGQVVPHEVIGMANYNKNLFVGVGGSGGIHASHYLSALYGMERIMGRGDTPLRRILNRASELYASHLPIVYGLTVVESFPDGSQATRGLFFGDDHDVFWRACELAAQVNCFQIAQAAETIVVSMDPAKYNTTWLANKAIYRTRMAIRDGGQLVVIAPGVERFGEDPLNDRLIRSSGYRTTPQVIDMVAQNPELRENLSVPAHLIHGSTEDRFEVLYCSNAIAAEELQSVGYRAGNVEAMTRKYRVGQIQGGWNESTDGKPFFFIQDPGLGLWMHRNHPHAFPARAID